MIVLKQISIQGFGSIINPLIYPLDNKGINIIFGKTGSGKSTILNALFWVIFGKVLKKGSSIEPWEDRQDKDFNGTIVRLSFDHGDKSYTIIRCKNYKKIVTETKDRGNSNFWLLPESKNRDKKDTQLEIENLFSYSPQLFSNSILFGQSLTRLINQSGPDKKKIFEEAFEVSFIEDIKNQTQKDLIDLENQEHRLEIKFIPLETQLQEKRTQRKNAEDWINSFEAKKKEDLIQLRMRWSDISQNIQDIKTSQNLYKKDGVSNTIIEYHRELTKLNNKLHDYKTLTDKEFKISIECNELEGEILEIVSRRSNLKRRFMNMAKNCPRCNQPLDKKKLIGEKHILKKEIIEISKKITKLNTKKTQLNGDWKLYKEDISSYQETLNRKKHLEYLLKGLEQRKDNYMKNDGKLISLNLSLNEQYEIIDKVIISKPDNSGYLKLKKEIINLKPPYLELKKELKEIRKKQELHRWAINDPLSNKGIKAYIFNTQLALVNKELLKYSQILGYRVQFTIDLESANKNFEAYIHQNNKIRPYEDLSGGQQQLVDVAIAFAIHDVTQLQRAINILIMDEVFEKLDAENIQIVTDLILTKAHNKSLHIITHRENFLSTSYPGIHLKLINGQTVKVD